MSSSYVEKVMLPKNETESFGGTGRRVGARVGIVGTTTGGRTGVGGVGVGGVGVGGVGVGGVGVGGVGVGNGGKNVGGVGAGVGNGGTGVGGTGVGGVGDGGAGGRVLSSLLPPNGGPNGGASGAGARVGAGVGVGARVLGEGARVLSGGTTGISTAPVDPSFSSAAPKNGAVPPVSAGGAKLSTVDFSPVIRTLRAVKRNSERSPFISMTTGILLLSKLTVTYRSEKRKSMG